jgi:hypothetical protein
MSIKNIIDGTYNLYTIEIDNTMFQGLGSLLYLNIEYKKTNNNIVVKIPKFTITCTYSNALFASSGSVPQDYLPNAIIYVYNINAGNFNVRLSVSTQGSIYFYKNQTDKFNVGDVINIQNDIIFSYSI